MEMKEIVNQREKYNDTDDMLEDKKKQLFLRRHPILRANKRFNDPNSSDNELFIEQDTQHKKKRTGENINPNIMEHFDLNFQVESTIRNSQHSRTLHENESDPLAQPLSYNDSLQHDSGDVTDCYRQKQCSSS